ncbi:glycosyltransferase [Ekhidna sp.]|uniref:glycosyltransferase n=1 Tax=Ekhidna sp. TaxID=2608089 RepID=UPI003CCC1F1C
METGKKTPLVSVILPFRNAHYLSEAIQSILDQTYRHFELILVDNNDSNSSNSLDQHFHDHPQIRYLREPHKGVVHAFNAGLKASKGSLIARMDADDVSDKFRLEYQVEWLLSNPEMGVVSGHVEYLGSDKNEGFIHYVDWLNAIQSFDEIRINQFVEFPLVNPSLMIRKALFDLYGSYREGDFPEDYEFFLRLMAEEVKMGKVSHPVLKWRDSPGRLTRTDDRYSQDAFFLIKAKYLTKWLKAHNPFHPTIYLWGAGRLSRRRSDYLLNEGIEAAQYIDVKEGGRTLHYKSIPSKDEAFIVSYVANRGARDEIRSYLVEKGYQEEVNFIIAS